MKSLPKLLVLGIHNCPKMKDFYYCTHLEVRKTDVEVRQAIRTLALIRLPWKKKDLATAGHAASAKSY